MSKIWVGIDLGKRGAICIMKENGDQVDIVPMPLDKEGNVCYKQLSEMFEDYEGFRGHVVYEKLAPIFGTSKTTAFVMGHQAGAMRMLCEARFMSYTEVPAKVWQKEMFADVPLIKKPGSKSNDTKAMALEACRKLYPDMKLTFGTRAKKPHDGLIDAILIADYCKKLY